MTSVVVLSIVSTALSLAATNSNAPVPVTSAPIAVERLNAFAPLPHFINSAEYPYTAVRVTLGRLLYLGDKVEAKDLLMVIEGKS